MRKMVAAALAICLQTLALGQAFPGEKRKELSLPGTEPNTGDCIGGRLPSHLRAYLDQRGMSLNAASSLALADEAEIPLNALVFSRLVPLASYRGTLPIQFSGRKDKESAAGLFVIRVTETGLYDVIARDGGYVEAFFQKTHKRLSPMLRGTIGCSLGVVDRYRLEPGVYILQITKTSGDLETIGFVQVPS